MATKNTKNKAKESKPAMPSRTPPRKVARVDELSVEDLDAVMGGIGGAIEGGESQKLPAADPMTNAKAP
ncbi:MAG: hypothetical protein HY791_16145 [Deltaproteobacteria bacterium]|nr:hypothetical protein [Deltaproteobacteria bacterium]